MNKEMSELLVNLQEKVKKQQSELDWYRTYGQFINTNYSSIDAEACSYADGDSDDDGYNNQEK